MSVSFGFPEGRLDFRSGNPALLHGDAVAHLLGRTARTENTTERDSRSATVGRSPEIDKADRAA
jgi:hypothetical protein